LCDFGIEAIAARLLELKAHLCEGLEGLGLTILGPKAGASASGITSCFHVDRPGRMGELHATLKRAKVETSFRHDRAGRPHLRFSPHFYNTHAEIEAALGAMREAG